MRVAQQGHSIASLSDVTAAKAINKTGATSSTHTGKQTHHKHPLIQFQQAIGNQVVRRLLDQRAIQAKLKIGQPGDRFEQEADRVADQVMRMPSSQMAAQTGVAASATSLVIQRLCPKCQENMQLKPRPQVAEFATGRSIQRVWPECEEDLQRQPVLEEEEEALQRQPEEEEETVQRKDRPGATPQVTPSIESGIHSLKGGGRPLSNSSRAFFEPRFGQTFESARIHAEPEAVNIARSINARAFTVGSHIAFNAGEYAPETAEGRRLLAHASGTATTAGTRRAAPKQEALCFSNRKTKIRSCPTGENVLFDRRVGRWRPLS